MKYLLVISLISVFVSSSSGSINRLVYDRFLHEMVKFAGGDYVELHNLCGTNDFHSVIYNSNLKKDSPYRYYLTDSVANGFCIKAVNRTGGRSYEYTIDWDVCRYKFSSVEERRVIGERIVSWIFNDLSQEEQRQLLLSLGWRGLFTQAEHPDYALRDVLGTMGSFINDDGVRSDIWKLLQDKDILVGIRGKETCLRSIVSMYESYPDALKKEVLANVKKTVELYFSDDGRLYPMKIRDWLRDQGQWSGSKEYVKKKVRRSKNPDDIFGVGSEMNPRTE